MSGAERARGARTRAAPRALRLDAARLRRLIDSVPAMITYVDSEERYRFCNRPYLEALRVGEAEVLGKTPRELLGDEAYRSVRQYVERALAGERVQYERRQRWPDGRSAELSVTYVPQRKAGKVAGFYALLVDITARKRAEEALRDREARLRTISDSLPALVAYVDAEQRYEFANRTYEDWFGLRPEQVIGRTMPEVLGERYAEAKPYIDEALAGRRAVHDREVVINAQPRALHNIYIPHFEGGNGHGVEGFFILATDISDRKAREQALSQLAWHDPLTGVPNRVLFGDRLRQALERGRRHRTSVALMYLDIDRFKAVNDTFGHAAGDELLKAFAARLVQCTRASDTVARLSGDEFVVLLDELARGDDALAVARKILAAMQSGFRVAGAVVPMTTSIGVAISEVCDVAPTALMARADAALYAAKAAGKGTYHVAP